jgi:hypothetical protein
MVGSLDDRFLSSRDTLVKSESVKFQSIVCRNSMQVIALALILEHTPSHLRAVRHLLLCSFYTDHN